MVLSRWVRTDHDVRDLLDVLERPHAADDDGIFYSAGCVSSSRVTMHRVTDDGVRHEESVGDQDELSQMFWQEFWNDDGCADGQGTGDFTTRGSGTRRRSR